MYIILRVLRMLCIDCVLIMCMLRVYSIFCVRYVYIMCISCLYHVYIMLSFWLCFCLVYACTCLPVSQLFTLYLSSIHWLTADGFILIYLLMRSVVVICSSLGLSIAFYVLFIYCPDKSSKLHNYGDLPAKSLSSAGPDTFAVAYSESLEATI